VPLINPLSSFTAKLGHVFLIASWQALALLFLTLFLLLGKDKLRDHESFDSSSSSKEDYVNIISKLLPSNPSLPIGMALDFSLVPTQSIYKLKKFLPTYSASKDRKQLVLHDSKVTLRKKPKKISSLAAWMSAIFGLGCYLQLRQFLGKSDGKFSWPSFYIYTERVSAYFLVYTFESVMLFDMAFPWWRHAYSLSWGSDNSFLKDLFCRVKNTGFPGKDTNPSFVVPTCQDWNCGNCKRGSSCKFKHVCFLCGDPSHRKDSCPKASKGAPGSP
jgi:hypothetical protein